MKNFFAALTLIAAVWGTSAHATIILSDNFDGYANQAAFQASWPAIAGTAPTSAELSSAQSVSSPNSIRVPGTAVTGQSRNRKSFTDIAPLVVGEKIVWSFDFYDVSSASPPARNYANLQDTTAPGGTNQLVSMGLNNNQANGDSGGNYYMARILGYSPANGADPDGGPNNTALTGVSQYFKLNDFSVGLRSTGWHNLKVEISTDDGLSTDYAFYVDGVLAELVSNVGTAASMRQYDNIAIGSGFSNASTEAFFDNMLLYQVPEPTSLLLAGFLGLSLSCVRTRR
jgi:hypothetical protein